MGLCLPAIKTICPFFSPQYAFIFKPAAAIPLLSRLTTVIGVADSGQGFNTAISRPSCLHSNSLGVFGLPCHQPDRATMSPNEQQQLNKSAYGKREHF